MVEKVTANIVSSNLHRFIPTSTEKSTIIPFLIGRRQMERTVRHRNTCLFCYNNRRVETMIKKALSMGFLWAGATSLCFSGYIVKFDHDSKIVFSSNFEGNPDISLLTRNQLTKLTDAPATDEWPVPDSKGESIVFTSYRSGNFDVYLMNLKTRDIKRLTQDSRDEVSPSWSADDRFVYYDLKTGRSSGQTMKLDIGSGRSLPLFPEVPYKNTIVPFENRRGGEIFFTAKALLGWFVAKYNVPDGKYAKLTESGSCRPKVSPDGKKVAYVCFDDDG